jgi:hypothetical protein
MIKNQMLIFFFIFTSSAWATPKKIEMIFLSPPKTAAILEMIDKIEMIKKYKKYTELDMTNCTPMGDGCFHPQYGYIEKSEAPKVQPKLVSDEEVKLKTFNAVEANMINCDKGNYFDIYCGKASVGVKTFENEIWFDTSSSLRSVDYNKDPNNCDRRVFLEAVAKKCKGKVDFSVYNTSLKQVGEYSSVCMAYGTNDEKRLLTWMKDSKTNRLLIVTDIDELSSEMRSFLEMNGAKMIGDGVKAFTTDDLIKYANDFSRGCN